MLESFERVSRSCRMKLFCCCTIHSFHNLVDRCYVSIYHLSTCSSPCSHRDAPNLGEKGQNFESLTRVHQDNPKSRTSPHIYSDYISPFPFFPSLSSLLALNHSKHSRPFRIQSIDQFRTALTSSRRWRWRGRRGCNTRRWESHSTLRSSWRWSET